MKEASDAINPTEIVTGREIKLMVGWRKKMRVLAEAEELYPFTGIRPLKEAAEIAAAVEAKRTDIRSTEEIIQDGTNFIMDETKGG